MLGVPPTTFSPWCLFGTPSDAAAPVWMKSGWFCGSISRPHFRARQMAPSLHPKKLNPTVPSGPCSVFGQRPVAGHVQRGPCHEWACPSRLFFFRNGVPPERPCRQRGDTRRTLQALDRREPHARINLALQCCPMLEPCRACKLRPARGVPRAMSHRALSCKVFGDVPLGAACKDARGGRGAQQVLMCVSCNCRQWSYARAAQHKSLT